MKIWKTLKALKLMKIKRLGRRWENVPPVLSLYQVTSSCPQEIAVILFASPASKKIQILMLIAKKCNALETDVRRVSTGKLPSSDHLSTRKGKKQESKKQKLLVKLLRKFHWKAFLKIYRRKRNLRKKMSLMIFLIPFPMSYLMGFLMNFLKKYLKLIHSKLSFKLRNRKNLIRKDSFYLQKQNKKRLKRKRKRKGKIRMKKIPPSRELF